MDPESVIQSKVSPKEKNGHQVLLYSPYMHVGSREMVLMALGQEQRHRCREGARGHWEARADARSLPSIRQTLAGTCQVARGALRGALR